MATVASDLSMADKLKLWKEKKAAGQTPRRNKQLRGKVRDTTRDNDENATVPKESGKKKGRVPARGRRVSPRLHQSKPGRRQALKTRTPLHQTRKRKSADEERRPAQKRKISPTKSEDVFKPDSTEEASTNAQNEDGISAALPDVCADDSALELQLQSLVQSSEDMLASLSELQSASKERVEDLGEQEELATEVHLLQQQIAVLEEQHVSVSEKRAGLAKDRDRLRLSLERRGALVDIMSEEKDAVAEENELLQAELDDARGEIALLRARANELVCEGDDDDDDDDDGVDQYADFALRLEEIESSHHVEVSSLHVLLEAVENKKRQLETRLCELEASLMEATERIKQLESDNHAQALLHKVELWTAQDTSPAALPSVPSPRINRQRTPKNTSMAPLEEDDDGLAAVEEDDCEELNLDTPPPPPPGRPSQQAFQRTPPRGVKPNEPIPYQSTPIGPLFAPRPFGSASSAVTPVGLTWQGGPPPLTSTSAQDGQDGGEEEDEEPMVDWFSDELKRVLCQKEPNMQRVRALLVRADESVRCLHAARFANEVVLQQMEDMRTRFNQRLSQVYVRSQREQYQHRHEEQQWNQLMNTTIEQIRLQMDAGLKDSIAKITNLQEQLTVEKERSSALEQQLSSRNDPVSPMAGRPLVAEMSAALSKDRQD